MRSVGFTPASAGGGLKVLCLGAHADDIEIGCGGTVLRLLAEYPGLDLPDGWCSAAPVEARAGGARQRRPLFLAGAGERRRGPCFSFRDGHFFFRVALLGIKDAARGSSVASFVRPTPSYHPPSPPPAPGSPHRCGT